MYWNKMLKKLILFCLSCSFIIASETFSIDEFEVTLFSKTSKNAKAQIQTSLIFEGRDVDIYDFKITDALNIVIGSFYAEDLLTSKGKEALKTTLIKYVTNKYSIDIDAIYIQKLRIVESSGAKEIIKALESDGYIKK